MLIDTFGQDVLDKLFSRHSKCEQGCGLYILVDGAFVSGIHKVFSEEEKCILFDVLPSCRDETRNVSPFLIRCSPLDSRLHTLLERSSGWPMISLIETPESLSELFNRLAAWCIVEVGRDRYNFRFADTRRLPTIINHLSIEQRCSFLGPMLRWSVIGRDGNWADFQIPEGYPQGRNSSYFPPVLQKSQFNALVDDSRADEIIAIMAYRGEETTCTKYQRWFSVATAINAADAAGLNDSDSVEWAIWWVNNYHVGDVSVTNILRTWCKNNAVLDGKSNIIEESSL